MTLPLWGLACLSIPALLHMSCGSFFLKFSAGNTWTARPRGTSASRSALAGSAPRAIVNVLETAPVFLSPALAAKPANRQSALISGGPAARLAGGSRVTIHLCPNTPGEARQGRGQRPLPGPQPKKHLQGGAQLVYAWCPDGTPPARTQF